MFAAAVDSEVLRDSFATRRSIAIRNFLEPSAAESIFHFLDSRCKFVVSSVMMLFKRDRLRLQAAE